MDFVTYEKLELRKV